MRRVRRWAFGLASAGALTLVEPAEAQCPVGYTATFGTSCYRVVAPSGTWLQAQTEAHSLGALLVHVNSAAENSFLVGTFGVNYWIGLTDQVTEGVYVWDDGAPLLPGEALWGAGEPNDFGNEDYIHLRFPDGLWNDLPASSTLNGGIAEISIAAVPEPGSVMLLGGGLLAIAAIRRRRRG
jgi:hypothetical protein